MWALGALFVAGCAETEKATTDSAPSCDGAEYGEADQA